MKKKLGITRRHGETETQRGEEGEKGRFATVAT